MGINSILRVGYKAAYKPFYNDALPQRGYWSYCRELGRSEVDHAGGFTMTIDMEECDLEKAERLLKAVRVYVRLYCAMWGMGNPYLRINFAESQSQYQYMSPKPYLTVKVHYGGYRRKRPLAFTHGILGVTRDILWIIRQLTATPQSNDGLTRNRRFAEADAAFLKIAETPSSTLSYNTARRARAARKLASLTETIRPYLRTSLSSSLLYFHKSSLESIARDPRRLRSRDFENMCDLLRK